MTSKINRLLIPMVVALLFLMASCTATRQPSMNPRATGSIAMEQPVQQVQPINQQPLQQKPSAAAQNQSPSADQGGKYVDLVICLDTSNSMDGLIASAKQKLWDIVNEVSLLKPRPVLRVALFSYGNDGYDRNAGWVRLETDFTSDLDLVNEKLFGLKTYGGTEFVARVIADSLHKLSWSKDKGTLRMIFVAGNETAHQDKLVTIQSICTEATQRDVIVNAIFCGKVQEGERLGWKDVATKAGGSYFAIDQTSGTIVVKTPYDEQLANLSGKLNGTYVAYGAQGRARMMNQVTQDANAQGMSSYAAASRAQAKSSELYDNRHWDLVDARKDKNFKLESVEKEALPEPMKTMSVNEREAYVVTMEQKRKEIQVRIKDLSQKRQEFINKSMKESAKADTFDHAIRQAVTTQAVNKGFQVAK
jgi:hypothetical protein